jgi:hypothetical protein
MTPSSQRCIWSAADLDGWDVPSDTRHFLMTAGLPYGLGQSTIEFGIHTERHVIGFDYEHPIFVAADGSVWHQLNDSEIAFMNSSVMHLSLFIELSDTFDAVCLDDTSEDIGTEIERWQQQLADADPAAFIQSSSVWPQIVDDARMNLY